MQLYNQFTEREISYDSAATTTTSVRLTNTENAETAWSFNLVIHLWAMIYSEITSCSSTTINSHILRMITIVGSIGVSWARGQSWFRTRTSDIVQPDLSSSGTKPAEHYNIAICTQKIWWVRVLIPNQSVEDTINCHTIKCPAPAILFRTLSALYQYS